MDQPSENNLINPNTTDMEHLTSVPGIGPALAERIIDARPFTGLGDLRRVSGIGPQSLEKFLPYLTMGDTTVSQALPEEQPGLEAEGNSATKHSEAPDLSPDFDANTVSEQEASPNTALNRETTMLPLAGNSPDQAENDKVQFGDKSNNSYAIPADASKTPSKPTPLENRIAIEKLTRADLIRLVLISNLLTLILTVFITLGILFNLNHNSLQFALPADINQLAQQASDLDLGISTLEDDQTALRTRIDNMESMAGRLDEMEIASAEIRSIVDSNAIQVQSLASEAITLTLQINTVAGQVETLGVQVGELQTNSERYQQFFEGLTALLANIFPQDK